MLVPLFPFFVVGTMWFWLLVFCWFCAMVYAIEKDRGMWWPTATLILMTAVLLLFGTGVTDLLHWMRQNPLWTGIYVVGYFIIGAVYTGMPYGKWYWFVHDVLDCNRERKAVWLSRWEERYNELQATMATTAIAAPESWQKNGAAQHSSTKYEALKAEYAAWAGCGGRMTTELLPYWREFEKSQQFVDTFGQSWPITKPLLRAHKSRITSWIVYWPPVLFWSLLNDPLRRIGRCLYNIMQGIMQHTTDSAWKDEDNVYTSTLPEATKTTSESNP